MTTGNGGSGNNAKGDIITKEISVIHVHVLYCIALQGYG